MKKYEKYKNKIDHLESREIEDLKSDYYAGKNIQDLLFKYNIDTSPSSLFRTFPLIKVEDQKCKYCKVAMYLISPPKMYKNRKEYICSSCEHKVSVLPCKCKNCLYQQAMEKVKTQAKEKLYKKTKPYVNIAREYPHAPLLRMLNINERLYLGALLRVHLYHKYLLIDLNNKTHNFAPTAEYRDKIIETLKNKHIITTYKIRKHENTDLLEKYIQGEIYDICITDTDKDKRDIVTDLMYPDFINTNYSRQDILMLKDEIQINEGIEYMLLIIKKFNFYTFNVDEKFRILFLKILEQYTLQQLFNYIYIAVRNLAAYSKQQSSKGYIPVANYIYKSILNRYDKAQKLNWNIIPFNRIYEAEETELSKLTNSALESIN